MNYTPLPFTEFLHIILILIATTIESMFTFFMLLIFGILLVYKFVVIVKKRKDSLKVSDKLSRVEQQGIVTYQIKKDRD